MNRIVVGPEGEFPKGENFVVDMSQKQRRPSGCQGVHHFEKRALPV